MMTSRHLLTFCCMLLAFLALCEGMTLRSLGVEQRCHCNKLEARNILRHIKTTIELNLPSSHCERTEVIATLKKTGKPICLDPNAPWVNRLINPTPSN